MRYKNTAFLTLGVAFIAIGIAQRNVFFILGLVFLILGFIQRKSNK